MLNEIIKAKKITGNPVPMEKTIGNNNPSNSLLMSLEST